MAHRTILIIDDERDLAALVRRSLEKENFDVILAPDGVSGLRIAKEHQPDLIVLDLTLPDIDGLDICRQLRREPRHARVPIIVLSARASPTDRALGLELGADDYLVKPFLPRELLARVRAVLRRTEEQKPHHAKLHTGDLLIDLHGHKVIHAGMEVPLTAAEFRIVEFLASSPGRVFTRDEIINGALHSDADVTERTVDAHIVGIRKALGAAAQRLQTIRGVGYVFRPI